MTTYVNIHHHEETDTISLVAKRGAHSGSNLDLVINGQSVSHFFDNPNTAEKLLAEATAPQPKQIVGHVLDDTDYDTKFRMVLESFGYNRAERDRARGLVTNHVAKTILYITTLTAFVENPETLRFIVRSLIDVELAS